ncbi:MAG: 2-C-methyl-D-erythritol 4-phosphate cytidylyltransferase [Candidatus Kapaibacteriales bacterium]
MNSIGLIITAGGIGSRFGSELPKQLLELNKKPLLAYSLETFLKIEGIESIVITYPTNFEDLFIKIIKPYKSQRKIFLVKGGKERMNSVWNGLQHKSIQECKYVLIHDSVRPFVSKRLIEELINQVQQYDAVIPGIPVKDTLKIGEIDTFVEATIDRSRSVAVQTPQAFQTKLLTKAYEMVLNKKTVSTDESSIIESYNHKVKIILGEEINFKITSKFDFIIAKLLVNNSEQMKNFL